MDGWAKRERAKSFSPRAAAAAAAHTYKRAFSSRLAIARIPVCKKVYQGASRRVYDVAVCV